MLLIIKPTSARNTKDRLTTTSRSFEDDRIKGAYFFLIKVDISGLHKCEQNKESIISIISLLDVQRTFTQNTQQALKDNQELQEDTVLPTGDLRERVVCRVPGCSPALASIQIEIMSGLQSLLTMEGQQLEVGDSGPALVLVNNSSRLGSDVKRDVAKAGRAEVDFSLLCLL